MDSAGCQCMLGTFFSRRQVPNLISDLGQQILGCPRKPWFSKAQELWPSPLPTQYKSPHGQPLLQPALA